MKKLSGIPVSDGIAIGRVLKLKKEERAVEAYTICEEDIENEISVLRKPLRRCPVMCRRCMSPPNIN